LSEDEKVREAEETHVNSNPNLLFENTKDRMSKEEVDDLKMQDITKELKK
jgi:hypothetical protein